MAYTDQVGSAGFRTGVLRPAVAGGVAVTGGTPVATPIPTPRTAPGAPLVTAENRCAEPRTPEAPWAPAPADRRGNRAVGSSPLHRGGPAGRTLVRCRTRS